MNAWLAAAANPANLATVNFSDFTIYTPIIPSDAKCPSYPMDVCPNTPPQEFMTYSASEPSFFGILGADLLLFGCGMRLGAWFTVLALARSKPAVWALFVLPDSSSCWPSDPT